MTTLPLITEPQSLASQLDADNLLIIDLRAPEAYQAGHIPNAINASLSEIVQTAAPVGGLLGTQEQVSTFLSRIGYNGTQQIIVVDDNGGPQAARLIWTLEAYSIDNTSFLDGGMVAWDSEIGVSDNTIESPNATNYIANLNGSNSADRDYIESRLSNDNVLIVDARTEGEYNGTDVRSARGGHIPGALHFEWSQMKDKRTQKLNPLDELQNQFKQAGISSDKEIIAYCQTHMRSSVICLALRALGYTNVKGYPGAWSDWGNQEDTPIE